MIDGHQSEQTEQFILGGLMRDNSAWNQINGTLKAEDFFCREHQLIYRAIAILSAKGQPFDVVTITNQLGGHLQAAGGLDYLRYLDREIASATNIRTYADTVRTMSERRQVRQKHLEAAESTATADAEALEIQRAEIVGNKVTIICADSIQPKPITWLWPGWLAAGKFHTLGGAPGGGKTTLVLAWCAALTTQGRWPDGTQAPLGDVLIWSGEDDPEDTLVPRLMACGADMSRAHIVGGVLDGGRPRPFDPATDIPLLEAEIRRIERPIRMLLVDPVVMAVAGDSHKNAETRRSLQPLVDIGQRLQCAVIGNTHLTKGTAGREPVERLVGSLAFGALARVVMVAAKMPEEDGREGVRLLARAKSNIGPDGGGYEYHLDVVDIPGHAGISNTRVTWGAALEGSARELLGQAEALSDPEEHSALGEAKAFLLDLLADGPVPKKEIEKDADGMGISPRTLDRAKKALGIESHKEGFAKRGVWKWRLPAKDAKNTLSTPQDLLAPFGESGVLSENEDKPKTDDDDDASEYEKATRGW